MKAIFSSKRDRYLTSLSVLLIIVALIAGMAGCNGYTPPPPSQDLEIRDWYDLNDIRDNPAGNHTLMNDLNSNTTGYDELVGPTANEGIGWLPIWDFTGSFDGQGYEIRDLFINRPNWCTVGLFAEVGKVGLVEDVGVVNANVTGSSSEVNHGCECAGILVGANLGTVNDCYCTGSVTCEWPAGGLVGENYGTVSNSYYGGNVTSNTAGGGLVGINHASSPYNSNGGTAINSHYDYDEVLINGENIITIGALSGEDFEEWLANGRSLDINDRLSEEDGYYLINNISDFKQLLAFGQNSTLKYRLTDDLDLATEPDFYIPYLAGKFDGNGHKISNLSLNFSFVYSVGLFGCLAPGGRITQVNADNININTSRSAGGLLGYNCEGTVSHCYAEGNVVGGSNVGGLAGFSDGILNDSYFSGSVTGGGNVGGLLGENRGAIIDSSSTGTVTGESDVGGLVGSNWMGTVINSYSQVAVTGASWVGGLAGYNWRGTISSSYSTGTIVGGIIPGRWGTGGAAGGNTGTMINCYSTGSVSCDELVGGLVGLNANDGIVQSCYSTGSVTGSERVGGLVGGNSGTVVHSFWDYETSGRAYSYGGTGKTTAEMQNIDTFSGVGWDIIEVADPGTRNHSYIWNIANGLTYPFLSWQP